MPEMTYLSLNLYNHSNYIEVQYKNVHNMFSKMNKNSSVRLRRILLVGLLS
jgi:hypothetical protein